MTDFNLLRNKEILAILDGDKNFGEINGIVVSMPYLSGPKLCSISTNFGFARSYPCDGGAISRWAYLDDLIEYCIKVNKVQELLTYLFAKENFKQKLKDITPVNIDEIYNAICKIVIEQINGLLYFGGNELVIINKQFIVKPINSNIEIEAPLIKIIDRDYIKNLSDRATQDIENRSFDSAITKSRTLIEEVFCYVIESNNQEPSNSGDIGELYKQIKNLYNMHQEKDVDKRINMLLSGLEKIIISIAQMRNNNSDSHGLGSKRIAISEHHARLFLNASIMMSEFILSVAKNNDNT